MRLWGNFLATTSENENVVEGKHTVIIGLGETGYSVARYLYKADIPFAVLDSNPAPDRLGELERLIPGIEIEALNTQAIQGAKKIIVSPGVPLSLPVLQQARNESVEITGDVAMFGKLARAPIAAITGSNGKSTVTSMVGALARHQISNVAVAGNIGTPCLDVLHQSVQLYVLEVSSFQLELATDLPLKVAALLNLSADHLDRYPDVDRYFSTKMNIFNQCEIAVINRHLGYPLVKMDNAILSFGMDQPGKETDFGVAHRMGRAVLLYGKQELLFADELKVKGQHNIQNCLAAMAIGLGAGLDLTLMAEAIKEYSGLAHRCEWIGSFDGVEYINDSKATNVGASVSAIESFAEPSGDAGEKVILILGGQGKDADFTPLCSPIRRHVKRVCIFGKDRDRIREAIGTGELFDDLQEIVESVKKTALPGDKVLFSPACASFDMFDNYQVRGEMFKHLVLEQRP